MRLHNDGETRFNTILLILISAVLNGVFVLMCFSYMRLCEIRDAIDHQTTVMQEESSISTSSDTKTEDSSLRIDRHYPVTAIKARITAYTSSPAETDSTPGRTAIMEKPIPGWTCAVSRDLAHWLGGRVWIEGVGVRRVNDLMNERFKRRVDVLVGKPKDAASVTADERKVVFLGKG